MQEIKGSNALIAWEISSPTIYIGFQHGNLEKSHKNGKLVKQAK